MPLPTEFGSREPVGVIGAGYVGLVSAGSLAAMGHRVTVRAFDAAVIDASGGLPICVPGLRELFDARQERLSFILSMSGLLSSSTLIFIALDTPPSHSGDAYLSRVQS